MTLHSLKIEGFRGFQTIGKLKMALPKEGKPGSGLTILTGPNNAGKSSILEALRARHGHQPPSLSEDVRNSQIQRVNIEYDFGEGQVECLQTVTTGGSETERTNFQNSCEIYVLQSRRSFNPFFGNSSSLSREARITNEPLPAHRPATLSGFEGRLFKLQREKDARTKFDTMLARVLGDLPTWTIELGSQGNYYLKFQRDNHKHSSDGLGEGIVSIFSVIDALYDADAGETVVIDEPELSLHPALQKRLMKLLVELAEHRQIVIATHSPYFIDAKALENGAELARIVSGKFGTLVHQLDAVARASIVAISKSNRNNPHVFGLDAKEIFFLEDGVIVTEGQEDVVLLPKIAGQVERTVLDCFFGWGAGGAGNIEKICDVLSSLGFERVVAILDGDKVHLKDGLELKFHGYKIVVLPAADIRTKPAEEAKDAKDGVLNENGKIRPDMVDTMRVLFEQMDEYLDPKVVQGKPKEDHAHQLHPH